MSKRNKKYYSFSRVTYTVLVHTKPDVSDGLFILFFFRRSAIHAEAPEFVEMSTEQEILVTGIKVVDLLAPYAKGGKIGMFD